MPETETRLADYAEQSAEALGAAPYDPSGNAADRIFEDARLRDLAELQLVKEQAQEARAQVGQKERDAADAGPRTAPPPFPAMVAVLGMLGISITLCLTFHDLVFASLLSDSAQAIMASFLCGALIAGLITWGLLAGAQHEGSERTHWGWMALGLLFGVGLLLMRLSASTSSGEQVLAWGFAILEVSAVLILELFAYGLRREWRTYRERNDVVLVREEQVAAAQRAWEDRKAATEELERRIAEREEASRKREGVARALGAVRNSARSAIVAGYRTGIEANRARLRGASVTRPTTKEIRGLLGHPGRTNGHAES